MGKFQFYHINEHYISYLHSIDTRVQYNKGQRRPYVGIVLSINGIDYYVPLESPKPNHVNIKGGGPVMKLDDGRLGLMGFNNMIPVIPSCLIKFDIQSIENENYKMLLLNQLNYCNKNRDLILQRAESTYRKALSRKIPLYQKVCCNFEKLERKSKKYDPNYVPSKKENSCNRTFQIIVLFKELPAGCSLFYKRTTPSSRFQPEGQTKSPPRYAWQATWNYNQSPRYFKSCTKYWPDCRSRSSRSRSRLPKITKPLSP